MKVFNFLLFTSLLLSSCQEKKQEKEIKWTKEQSVTWNKNMALEEELQINLFLSKKDWKMQKTGSGLRYYIYKNGNGKIASEGQEAKIKYSIRLLDGKLCYQTENGETFMFQIDKSEIESGVQEGIKKMKVGDKAKLIIPSHIAHGLVGDLDKIPPLSPIVVDVELLELKP
ncbi:MAG: FKBP-type peptidyl-prolyl cis-trans isomerase [Flavobacteriia bacterium]|nr:FKBP-type peptidyl-prolyl cis-trans isomerase [Flavobacteriia bacterium]